jgi:four helix bundle protein
LRLRTFEFAVCCVRFCHNLPRNWEAREVARQLLRSGTSVAANYRAACRGRSRREFIAKLAIAVEEADETLMWLELLDRTRLVETTTIRPVRVEAGELLAVLSRSLRTTKDNLKAHE